ncbi:MAG TPA: tRNA 2-thiocytidine biosynthesis TtcA family protein [Oscillospiraceae bacterium]|nr:tRNA 2-thiocytidine biosynthesis TtcA family protein [Oscillospiraceae bacterium]
MKLPKWIVRRFWRAIVEFKLLEPGDRVLVGLSGGKDSSFLVTGLKVLQEHAPFHFDLAAVHIDQGFPEIVDLSPLADLCTQLNVPLEIVKTQIYQMAFTEEQSPCARCAYFRRGFMHNYAEEKQYNKVALAHHLDDAVETFLMSQLFTGQLKTFQPKSYLSRTGVTVIRPLIYFREKEIKQAERLLMLNTVSTPCPYAGHSARAKAKDLLRKLESSNDRIFDNLVVAMREGAEKDLWPAPPSKGEFRNLMTDFWQRQ